MGHWLGIVVESQLKYLLFPMWHASLALFDRFHSELGDPYQARCSNTQRTDEIGQAQMENGLGERKLANSDLQLR